MKTSRSSTPLTHHFKRYLQERLEAPLPGKKAQLDMAPTPLDGSLSHDPGAAPAHARTSGVMLIFTPDHSQGHRLIYTLRNSRLAHHGGQISFPGGQSEDRESSRETALRETREELNISADLLTVVGELSPLYVPVSNNIIYPWIAFSSTDPDMKLQPSEVAAVYRTGLDELDSPRHQETRIWKLRGQPFRIPLWNLFPVPLWGATAMITSELIALYREFRED